MPYSSVRVKEVILENLKKESLTFPQLINIVRKHVKGFTGTGDCYDGTLKSVKKLESDGLIYGKLSKSRIFLYSLTEDDDKV